MHTIRRTLTAQAAVLIALAQLTARGGDAQATNFNTLYSFQGGADGAIPGEDRIAFDANGNVYGSASAGGDFNFNQTGCPGNLPGGCGVVFRVKQ